MVVIGQDVERAVADIDAIFATNLARCDKDWLGSRIVCRHQPHFAGHIVAGGDDDPVFLRSQPDADAKADIILLVEQLRLFRIIAEAVIIGIVGAPIFVGEAIDKALAVLGPDDARKRAGDDVLQLLAGFEVADVEVETFRTIIVIGISEQLAIGADLGSAKPEIILALGELVFIEDQLVRTALYRLAVMLAILRALVKFRPIDEIAILLRD